MPAAAAGMALADTLADAGSAAYTPCSMNCTGPHFNSLFCSAVNAGVTAVGANDWPAMRYSRLSPEPGL